MGLSKETLALLGLDENATDEEISAKVAEINGAKAKAEGDLTKIKASFDKTSSELASLKKEKMTDEEKRQVELKEYQDRLNEAQKQINLNNLEKQYLNIGMGAESASAMAQAVLDGDYQKQGEIMTSFKEKVANDAKIEALKGQKNPNIGNPDDMADAKYTKDNFKKGLLSFAELNDLKLKNPKKYEEITGVKLS